MEPPDFGRLFFYAHSTGAVPAVKVRNAAGSGLPIKFLYNLWFV